jgi:hypothetical protein
MVKENLEFAMINGEAKLFPPPRDTQLLQEFLAKISNLASIDHVVITTEAIFLAIYS